MKKLAILVLISTLLTFTAAMALAHDDENNFKNFHGTYDMTASGSCIHSENGFNDIAVITPTLKFIGAKAGVVYAGTTVLKGTWTFEKNGTGTYSDKLYATVTPPPSGSITGGIRIFEDNDIPFTYNINAFGDITINEITTPFLEYTGSVSRDKKNMVLTDTPKIKGPFGAPFWYIICNTSRTLIKVSD